MTYEDVPLDASGARQWVGEIEHLRRRVRTARQGSWFPLAVLGLVITASTPLYRSPTMQAQLGLPADVVFRPRPGSHPASLPNASAPCVVVHGVVYTPCSGGGHASWSAFFPAGLGTASPRAIALYWLIALPLAYLLIAWWYRRRAQRLGASTAPIAYVATAIALVAFMVVTSAGALSALGLGRGTGLFTFGDLGVRGLVPLLTVSLGLFVLAYCERSRALAGFAVSFLALSLLVDLYDLENVVARLGLVVGPEIGVFVAGVYLFAAGLAFGFAHRRAIAK